MFKNTQFDVDDVFGGVLRKEALAQEQITKFINLST